MGIIKPAIFRQPFTAVKGRYCEIPFVFYQSWNKKTETGTPRDLTGIQFSADFRYDTDDTGVIFSLGSAQSPASIDVEPLTGRVVLKIDQDASDLVLVPASKTMELPIRRVVFELKALYPDGRELTAALAAVNFYQNVTRSDQLNYVTYMGEYVTYNGVAIYV